MDELEGEGERLQRASEILGHHFRDPLLLLKALTHSSLLNEKKSSVGHNEILELLGDAVLSLCTIESLVRASPDAGEGELTDRRAAYVSEDALAQRADSLGLASLLRTGRSIEGRVPVSARADLVEALIGAVYQDAGLEAARAATLRVLGTPPAHAQPSTQNAKRVLQERLQRIFGDPPTYDIARVDGPNHAPIYEATAMFGGEVLGRGQGGSKRTATEAAAADAVSRIGNDDDATLRARFIGI